MPIYPEYRDFTNPGAHKQLMPSVSSFDQVVETLNLSPPFLPGSPNAASHARDGSRTNRSRLEFGGIGGSIGAEGGGGGMRRDSRWFPTHRPFLAALWAFAMLPSVIYGFASSRTAGFTIVLFGIAGFFIGERAFRHKKHH
jgi:hypothetical protein